MSKKILLITPILFHYHEKIIDELKSKNFEVFFFPDQPKGAFTALKRKIYPKITVGYYKNIYDKIKNVSFDYFLLINGKGITIEFLKALKNNNPKCRFITYQWDSLKRNHIERKADFLYILKYFDKSYSFDYEDCKVIKELNYLPNFHTIEKKPSATKEIDVFIVGSFTKERYDFIKNIQPRLQGNNYNYFFYLYMPWHHYAREVVIRKNFINSRYIKFKTISKREVNSLYQKSKSTVDLAYKNQTGFTMRILEGLSNNCKVFTTNKNIIKEGFYNSDLTITFTNGDFYSKFKEHINKPVYWENVDISEFHINSWIDKILS